MRIALRTARRGLGRVEPNPPVGCVLVRGGRELARGFHRYFGGPHAEVDALRRAGNARGATAYVTLEPCCYHGKTPPCTQALIAAGIRRVVAAVRDPNPRVSGRGLALLRRAGLQVDVGVLADEAEALIAPFRKLTKTGRPWVIAKWAQSLDGRIATRTGDSRWISDVAARTHAHRTRARVDAIIIGARTAGIDDPLLTARLARPRRVAARVVLDPNLRTPTNGRLVRTAGNFPTWICCDASASKRRRAELLDAGCRIITLARRGDGSFRLARLL
ncbi:MAG: bifunctional diaminohydroxyphosphoribosylaminopyrimidine deaminase/5-amino-6-(5-phosphoribosylamino)uracil reductase RibD, partial [Planctomycetota bacterium]